MPFTFQIKLLAKFDVKIQQNSLDKIRYHSKWTVANNNSFFQRIFIKNIFTKVIWTINLSWWIISFKKLMLNQFYMIFKKLVIFALLFCTWRFHFIFDFLFPAIFKLCNRRLCKQIKKSVPDFHPFYSMEAFITHSLPD